MGCCGDSRKGYEAVAVAAHDPCPQHWRQLLKHCLQLLSLKALREVPNKQRAVLLTASVTVRAKKKASREK